MKKSKVVKNQKIAGIKDYLNTQNWDDKIIKKLIKFGNLKNILRKFFEIRTKKIWEIWLLKYSEIYSSWKSQW